MNATIAAFVYLGLSLIAILFQLALAFGAPWGAASMGGKFPGVYPVRMRMAAGLNALLIGFLALIVLAKAELILPALFPFANGAIWFVVGFSALGTVLNTITPSKIERIWAPVLLIQFVCSLWIALS